MIVKQSIKIGLSLLLINSLAFGASNLESGVQELGVEISKSMINKKKTKLAIIEFSDLGDNVNDLGRYLAEKLISELFKLNSKGFSIIERRQLAKVLREQKLSTSGLIDAKAMQKVGNLLGVDAIVTGSIADLGNIIEINARVISVETGDIIGSASSQIPKVGNVTTLMSQNSVKISHTSTNSTHTSSSKKSSNKSKEFKYSGKNLDITYRNIKRNKGVISMVVVYQNSSKKPIKLAVQGNETSLSDENGEIWTHQKSSLLFDNPYNGTTTIPAGKKLISKMTFTAKGATDGKIFNLTAKYAHSNFVKDKFVVIINDIKI